MGNRRIALIVAVAVCLPFAIGGCAEIPFPSAESASTAAPAAEDAAVRTGPPRGPIVGTYQLVGRNVKDENGAWVPTPDFNSLGYITYGDTGYMAVNVMPLDRQPFADTAPTPEEAQAALDGYTAYYGPFSVDEDAEGRFLVHHRIGQMNPGGEVDAKRFYDLEGDRLILTPRDRGGDEGRRHTPGRLGAVAGRRAVGGSAAFRRLPPAPVHGSVRAAGQRVLARAAEQRPRRLLDHLHADRSHDGAPDGARGTHAVRRRDPHPGGGPGRVPVLRRVFRTVHRA